MLLSVVIATYNAESYIQRALNSFTVMNCKDIECLVIDGKSSDNTINIVRSNANKDKRIRYISEPDKGIYDAFNKGWRLAKGDWIFYLGADDQIIPDDFLAQVKIINGLDKSYAVVNGGIKRLRKDGTSISLYSKGFWGSHQSMFTRRTCLCDMGGFDIQYKLLADFDLMARLANSKYLVFNTKFIIAEYQAGGASEQRKNLKRIFKEKYNILKTNNSKWPLYFTIKDCFKMIMGGIIH